MKIIVNNNENVICLTQLKDIAYLSEYTSNKMYIKKYIDLVNQGFNANDFIRITNKKIINDLINCEDIYNYPDYCNLDSFSIVRIISINAKSSMNVKSTKKRNDELQYLLNVNSENPDYKIPLVKDGKINIIRNGYEFSSTVIPNYYILTCNDDINDGLYQDFLDQCIASLEGNYNVVSTIVNDKVVVKLIPMKKKFSLKKTPKNS